jgi:hypothetical protein
MYPMSKSPTEDESDHKPDVKVTTNGKKTVEIDLNIKEWTLICLTATIIIKLLSDSGVF